MRASGVTASRISDLAGLTDLPAPAPASIRQWQGIAELLLTQKGLEIVRKLSAAAVALAAIATSPAAAVAADATVNIYSYRQEFLIRPLLDAFTKQSGIQVKVVFANKGVLERLQAEGVNTPADLILTVDIARLKSFVDAGLTRPVTSALLERNIPAHFRHPDGHWYALTSRARVLYVSKDRVAEGAIRNYEDLVDPKWREGSPKFTHWRTRRPWILEPENRRRIVLSSLPLSRA